MSSSARLRTPEYDPGEDIVVLQGRGQLAGGENAAADNEVAEADAALSLAFSHFIDTDLLVFDICPPLEPLLEAPTSCFAAIC